METRYNSSQRVYEQSERVETSSSALEEKAESESLTSETSATKKKSKAKKIVGWGLTGALVLGIGYGVYEFNEFRKAMNKWGESVERFRENFETH